MSFEGPKLHFITGKGGVGKSILAQSLALKLAREGRRVLWVEVGEQNQTDNKPQALSPQLSHAQWAGEACLKEYILHYVKIEKMVDLFFENRVMKALVHAAPALKELAILGKITSGNRRVGPALVYDDIVVDAYATGHFRALLQAPQGMAEAIQFGPMGDQCRSILAVVKDPQVTSFYVVIIPEELPVTEGMELAQYLTENFQDNVTIVKNRWLVPPLDSNELALAKQKLQGSALEFANFLEFQLNRQHQFAERLKNQKLLVKMPFYFIPSSKALAEKLSEHWGKQ